MVRAGLELVAAVNALKALGATANRVGIATELVIVGDLIRSRAAQEQAVVGETPNLLATRLQAAAGPGTIAIDQATRRLLVRSGPPGPPRQAIDDRLPVATIR